MLRSRDGGHSDLFGFDDRRRVYLRGRIRSTTDFLVAGRKLSLALTTATMAAVQIGAGVILGGAELGAESGAWPGMWYGLGCGGGLVLAGVFVAPKLRARGSYVPLRFFERRWRYTNTTTWLRKGGFDEAPQSLPRRIELFVMPRDSGE